MTVIAVGDRVLFAGGSYRNGIGIPFSNVLDIYNASTGKWSTGKLSSSHGIPRVAATIGTKAYFFSDSNLDIYDVVTGRVTSVASPENVDYNLPIQVIGSKAVLTSSSLTVYSAKIYDANGGNSSSLPFTPRPRFKATSLGTMAFFGGGGPLFFGNMPVDDGTHASPNDNLVDNYTDLSPSPVLSGGLSGRIGQPDQVTVSNTGDADLTGGYTIQLYASRDRTLGGAILVGSANVTSPLVAGTSSPFSIGTVIPQGTPHGQYHLLAAVRDSAGKITPIAAEQGIFSVGGTKGSSKGIAAEGSVRGSGGAFSGRDRARSNGR